MSLVKEILKDSELISEGQQAKIYVFTLNNKKYVLKAYKMFYNGSAQILKQLSHPNIIKCRDLFFDDDQVCLVMDYVGSESLEKRQRLEERHVQQLRSILQCLKENHVIHREIKPEHLLFDQNDDLVLIDFGWANINNEDAFNIDLKKINENYSINDEKSVEMLIKQYGVKKE